MSGVPDFTILVALDREHLDEFAVSYPTWIRHKPGLRQRPIVFVCDGGLGIDWHDQIAAIIREPFGGHDHESVVICYTNICAGQREKMLTALVTTGPRYVKNDWYLKLDCDLIATAGPDDWIDPAWFAGDPAWIAPRWHYSKPASMVRDFDLWADKHLEHFGALRTAHTIVGDVAKHRRMISYCMFGNTAWTRKMAELAGERLPVPSQDTFLSLAATRSGALTRCVDMKAAGWQHVGGGGRRLCEAAAAAMEGQLT